ncbi:MAG TPA: transglycosylase domain-containing protein [Thermohalobaculum sp.]|nr:transglycosylase domain-containing protein [Thermohalobaculum sp.]
MARGGLLARLLRWLIRLFWKVTWRLGLIGLLILGGATAWYYVQLPPHSKLFDGRGAGSVTMLDRHGNVFAWRGEQYGGELGATEVSPHLVHAVIAAEDKRFHLHPGVDPIGIARAMAVNLRAGRLVQGGSTLTQQVAKNTFLDASRTLERKLKEVPMALALEAKYSKEEILSIYLNRVYLGAGTWGFEAASQRYFGKSARLVSPAEAAMLAGLLRAPSRYAPTRSLGLAQERANVIVGLMEAQGYLTPAQSAEARANPAELSQAAAARAGGYFADWVMEQAPSFLGTETAEDVTIATTFDPAIQRAAEAAMVEVFENKVKPGSVAQAAIVVMTPDGAVRAMVGGRERGVGLFNRATQALRQTGSAFKPIVYAAALEAGMSPNDTVVDAPLTIDGWSPANYDNAYHGRMTMTEAFARSINTVAVRVSEQVGRERVRSMAGRMGLSGDLAPGAAIALGTSETTLVEMTGVFATIANHGLLAKPVGIREISLRGDKEVLLSQRARGGEHVLSERTAELLTYMMHRVVTEGTGARARLPAHPAAGKTGTTQGARDAWFIGFTADYVTGVWMGNDDNVPLTGVTGGGLPAEIWREAMTRIHDGLPARPLPARTPGSGGRFMAESGGAPAPARTPGQAGEIGSVVNRLLDGLFGSGASGDGAPSGGGATGGQFGRAGTDR